MTSTATARSAADARTDPDPALATPAARADLTLALRDLHTAEPSTPVARPTRGSIAVGVRYKAADHYSCGKYVCVHWVRSTKDKPSLVDKNHNGVPDWVDHTRKTADSAIATYVKAGYRAPLSDVRSSDHGPNRKLDIYLADLGQLGYYGYCDTDDPLRKKKAAVSAYCVVDNDFSKREYHAKPLSSMHVTLAHELFHAIQFAYDYREDRWLMEGTATWMEEQLYDSINDNRQFLRAQSPLANPSQPLDYFDPNASPAQYGVWSFFEYLSEKFPQRKGKLPTIVRDIWKFADNATKKSPRQWSTQAVDSALAQRGTSLAAEYAEFSQVNLAPASFYQEGAAWPAAEAHGSCTLGSVGPLSGCAWPDFGVTHLSSVSLKVLPDPTAATTTFQIDLSRMPYGVGKLTLVRADGARELYTFDPSGSLTQAAFNAAGYQYAVVTIANGSIRFDCGKHTALTCAGRSLDDSELASVSATPIAPPG